MAIREALDDSRGFALEVADSAAVAVVSAKGELDSARAPDLREALVRPEVLASPHVQVDLRQARFIDSSIIGLLVRACKRIRAANGTFSVSCGEGMVRQVLEISGLIDYFQIEDASPRSEPTAGSPRPPSRCFRSTPSGQIRQR